MHSNEKCLQKNNLQCFSFCRTVCLNIQHLLCYPRCVINSETTKRVSCDGTQIFTIFFSLINASYLSIHTLRESTISVRMCSKFASIDETFESRKLTPGSSLTSCTRLRYSGQATFSKYSGLSSQLSPSGSQTLLCLRAWQVSRSISTKYFLSHKLKRSWSLKITIPVIICFLTIQKVNNHLPSTINTGHSLILMLLSPGYAMVLFSQGGVPFWSFLLTMEMSSFIFSMLNALRTSQLITLAFVLLTWWQLSSS